jgi:hypothetical protein
MERRQGLAIRNQRSLEKKELRRSRNKSQTRVISGKRQEGAATDARQQPPVPGQVDVGEDYRQQAQFPRISQSHQGMIISCLDQWWAGRYHLYARSERFCLASSRRGCLFRKVIGLGGSHVRTPS